MKPAAATRHRQNRRHRCRSAAVLVDRIERLEEERKSLGSDIKEIYQEAASAGFDCKVLRRLIKDRRQDPAELEEQEVLLDIYRRALGQMADTPLGEAAIRRVA